MKVISYYELLEMIKNNIIPKVVNYKITGYIENYIEYTAQYDRGTFTHYELTNHHREDENIHFYLNENYLESDMFDKSILIIEDTPKEVKIPEKLKKKKTIDGSFEGETIYIYKYNEYEIGDTINEIIDYLDYLKSKGE